MSANYFILTYGCQMNVHESEKLAGILSGLGFIPCAEEDAADVIVLNTCCIRETAESHILGNLGRIKKLKEKKPSLIVAVGGCMTQKSEGAERLIKRCPFVDVVFGTHNLERFGEYLKARLQSGKRIVEVWEREREIAEGTPKLRGGGVNAWVNIMYGCDNYCSYCIVPYVRGRERSRSADEVFAEVRGLVEGGSKCITLLGQNVNSYGNDLGQKEGFAALLQRLCSIEGKFRLKFMTSHPKDLSPEVIRVMAENDKLARYVHLPVQSGSTRVLKLMNRKYSADDYIGTVEALRRQLPGVSLSSDVMVGFPTETEEDFLQTLALVEKVKFSNLYTFVYSRRSGTPADRMEQVDEKIKKDRIVRLIARHKELAREAARQFLNQTCEMLVERWQEGTAYGKTECDHSVEAACDYDATGQFINVRIIKTKATKLIAEIL